MASKETWPRTTDCLIRPCIQKRSIRTPAQILLYKQSKLLQSPVLHRFLDVFFLNSWDQFDVSAVTTIFVVSERAIRNKREPYASRITCCDGLVTNPKPQTALPMAIKINRCRSPVCKWTVEICGRCYLSAWCYKSSRWGMHVSDSLWSTFS